MIDKFLKIAGVNNIDDFYKLHPTEEHFFKSYPNAKKQIGKKIHRSQAAYGGYYANGGNTKKVNPDIAIRNAAQNTYDDRDNSSIPFTFPNGKTKKWNDMTTTEKYYVQGMSLKNKGRISPEENAWYDDYNPLNWLGTMAGDLGTAKYESDQTGSYMPIAEAIGTPLAVGAGASYIPGAMRFLKGMANNAQRYGASSQSTPKQLPAGSSTRPTIIYPKSAPASASRGPVTIDITPGGNIVPRSSGVGPSTMGSRVGEYSPFRIIEDPLGLPAGPASRLALPEGTVSKIQSAVDKGIFSKLPTIITDAVALGTLGKAIGAAEAKKIPADQRKKIVEAAKMNPDGFMSKIAKYQTDAMNISKDWTDLDNNTKSANTGSSSVREYQKMLNKKYGAGLATDGMWGPKTQAAYEKFVTYKQEEPVAMPTKYATERQYDIMQRPSSMQQSGQQYESEITPTILGNEGYLNNRISNPQYDNEGAYRMGGYYANGGDNGGVTGGGSGRQMYQNGGQTDQQQQIMQIIQAYAEVQGQDPREIMAQLQQLQPEEQQAAIQSMIQELQQGQLQKGQNEQQQFARGGMTMGVREAARRIMRSGGYYQMGGEAQEQPQQEMQESPQMQGQEQAMGQEQQGGGQDQMMQQLAQMVAQALQKGMPPEQIMQMLVKQGVPQEVAMQVIQMVMQQMQGGQGGPQAGGPGQQYQSQGDQYQGPQGQPPMAAMGGYYANGGINNPGFRALPSYVQQKIMNNMAYGGHYDNGGYFNESYMPFDY